MTHTRLAILAMVIVTLMAAFFGYELGQEIADLDEGEALTRVADLYKVEAGQYAHETDCQGTLADGRAWLEVRCQGAHGTYLYTVDRFGQIDRQPVEQRF